MNEPPMKNEEGADGRALLWMAPFFATILACVMVRDYIALLGGWVGIALLLFALLISGILAFSKKPNPKRPFGSRAQEVAFWTLWNFLMQFLAMALVVGVVAVGACFQSLSRL